MSRSKLAVLSLSVVALGAIAYWQFSGSAPSPLASAEPLASSGTPAESATQDSGIGADRVAASGRGENASGPNTGPAVEPASPVVAPEPKPISIAHPLIKFGDLETVLSDARLNPNGVKPSPSQRTRLAELLPTLNREAQVLFSNLSDEVDRSAQQKVEDGQFETQPLGERRGNSGSPNGVVVKIGAVDHQKVVIVRESDSAELELNLVQQRELWLRGKDEIASILRSP